MFSYKNKPIVFFQGDESRVVIEDEVFDDSIFKNQYERALKIIESFKVYENPEEQTVPNIVAFCGDRGEGKTSCMLSTAKIMERTNNKHNYEILPCIDPSFFDENHNIIDLVLGQLYKIFLNTNERKGRENLLICFNRVKNCLSTLTNGSDNVYDAIEQLDELGNSMNLRGLMFELVKEFLSYRGKDKRTLVVIIDDMDYNWKRAYEMSQLISKYLCLPNCILLISVSIGQMVDVIETSFKNELHKTGENSNFYEVAYKYIEKLIPLQYRVEMPHVYDLCNRRLEIYKCRGDKKPIIQYDSVKEGVVNEIFVKTRYLFYNYRDGVSQIVPRNLRMLRQLMGMLLEMDVYHKDSKDPKELESNQQNKLLFQTYFFTNWTRQLSSTNREFVNTLMRNQDLSQFNKLVVSYVKKSLPDKETGSFSDIINPANYSYNISIGDVFSLLNYIERNPKDDDDQLLVFFLKSYYSMLLYHYYDEITDNINALHSDEEHGGIYRTESWFKGTNKLQRFVNGAYFQYNHGELIKGMDYRSAYDGLDFDQYSIDIYSDFRELLMNTKKIILSNNQIYDDEKTIILLTELIILLVSWGSEHRIGLEQKKQRSFPQPHHLMRFDGHTTSLMIDILAPFCNVINLQFAYDRFKPLTGDLYGYALDHEWSLLRQMMAEVKDNDNLERQQMRLASDSIIRNAEVLTSIKEKILSIASTESIVHDYSSLLADFYEKIMDSEMQTYSTNPMEKPYTINFRFLKPISNLLKQKDIGSFFNEIMIKSQIERKEEEGIVKRGNETGITLN